MNQDQHLFFGYIFCLLISINVPAHAIDQSMVGVKNGEEYTYIMEKYSLYVERPNNEPTIETIDYLYTDNGPISLQDGDQFTYRILNATAYDRSDEGVLYFYPFAIDVEIIGPNGTIVNDELEIGFGTLLSDTNWTGYNNVFEESGETIDNLRENNPDITYIYELINTNNEFRYKFGSAFSGNDSDSDTYSNIREISYEKTSGMANLFSIENIKTEIIDNVTYKFEYIQKLMREGYSPNDGDSVNSPGFTMYVSISALLVLIYQRKKHLPTFK